MSVRVLPAVTAVIITVLLAAVLFVPFIAREYRRRGELRPGVVALRLATLLYAIGLVAYVLVPLPPVAPGFCEAFASYADPQLRPLASLAGLDRPGDLGELSKLLADGSVRQFGYNVVLFVPLGMVARYLFRRGFVLTVLLGFGCSLLIELSQFTGVWWVYPCPFRLFDVDDLIANTLGATAGAVFAPLLRLVPGQRPTDVADAPRPVTPLRRLLGMACDVLLLWWLGLATARLADLVLAVADVRLGPAERVWVESGSLWFAPAVAMLLLTAFGGGSSLGQHAVRLRSVAAAGGRPPLPRVLLRWLAGIGGLALLEGLSHAGPVPEAGAPLAVMWCTAHAVGVLRSTQLRGITGGFARLNVIDARSTTRADEAGLATER